MTPAAAPVPRTLDGFHPRRVRLRRWWRRRVLAHRRLLAFCCLVAAVLATLETLAPDAPPTERVRVVARDLSSGAVISAEDLSWSRQTAGSSPDGLLDDPVGRTVAAPMRRGEPVTDARVLAPGLMAGYPGRVATAVRISDPLTVELLRVGDTVDLLSADPRAARAATVARDAPVVALPREEPEVSRQSGQGTVVVVALAPHEVERVSVAAVRDYLAVLWRG